MSTATLPPLTRTERVVAWLRDNAGDNNFLRSVLANYDRWGRLSDKQLDAVERNMNRPARVANPNPVTEVGMYRDDAGVVFRVKLSKQGRLYAMRFVPEAQVKSERFVYAGGAVRALRADNRMSVAQAQALGVQFGICCVCGAELTASESVANGIGPVCAKRV
jgi:hypothetical protein